MRRPQKPPDLDSLDREWQEKRRFFTLKTAQGLIRGQKYLHWDDLRHRPTPGDLTHREWWFVTKAARMSQFKQAPYTAHDGHPFLYIETEFLKEALHRITKQSPSAMDAPSKILNPETQERYYISSIIEESITSSQLEGAATTSRDAREMIRQQRKPRDRSEKMIMNNYRTMRLLRTLKDEPLSDELVLRVHREVTTGTLDNPEAEGRYRIDSDGEVHVTDEDGERLFTPLSPETIPKSMEFLCDFANEKTPDAFVYPVIRAIIVHFLIGYIHPFVDGNGRTARALFYWSLLRSDYWLFAYLSISRFLVDAPAQYARSYLLTETDDNDLTYFIEYQVGIILRAMEAFNDYIVRKRQEMENVERLLAADSDLNYRQRALLSHALRNPLTTYTVASHRTSHNVSHQTARTDLLGLAEKGFLERLTEGRKLRFRPVENLQEVKRR